MEEWAVRPIAAKGLLLYIGCIVPFATVNVGTAKAHAMENQKIVIGTTSNNACFHGGAFFESIGPRFRTLERRKEVINADVLDAWFPPSPKVVTALMEHLPWLLQTSPPADAGGLVDIISETRGIPPESLMAGPGSSA